MNLDETRQMTMTEFVAARLDEDLVEAMPKTILVSGGWPAPEVPNCIGPSRTGDCAVRWALHGEGRLWWRTPEVRAQMDAHAWTHAKPSQRRMAAHCAAIQKVMEAHPSLNTRSAEICQTCTNYAPDFGEDVTAPCPTIRAILSIWSDHPDFNPDWA